MIEAFRVLWHSSYPPPPHTNTHTLSRSFLNHLCLTCSELECVPRTVLKISLRNYVEVSMGKVESTTALTSTTTNHTIIIDLKGGPTQSCMGIGCTLKCDNRGSIRNGEQDQPIVSIKASLMQGLKQAWSCSSQHFTCILLQGPSPALTRGTTSVVGHMGGLA